MPALETPFSELINRPRDTVEALLRSRGRCVRLRRRDAEDLMLTTVSRYEQEHLVLSAVTRLVTVLMHDEAGRGMLVEVLPEIFPWVRLLPSGDVRTFLTEFVATLRAAEDLDSLAPVAQLITEWRHTAEIHADSDLLAVLRQPAEDGLGPVPEPADD